MKQISIEESQYNRELMHESLDQAVGEGISTDSV